MVCEKAAARSHGAVGFPNSMTVVCGDVENDTVGTDLSNRAEVPATCGTHYDAVSGHREMMECGLLRHSDSLALRRAV